MARALHSLRKTLAHHLLHHHHHHRLLLPQLARRNYVSEMRNEAFEGNMLRLLRREIEYELQSSPLNQAITKFDSFMVDGKPGERWIALKRQFADEDIKVEVTMFDGAVPAPSASGGITTVDDVQLHITLVVSISKGGGKVLEISCSAWPDSIEINSLFVKSNEKTIAEPYAGPEFKELDDELQDSLYDFLEARGITDELAVFLHGYMKSKDKTEFIRWMQRVKSFIEKK